MSYGIYQEKFLLVLNTLRGKVHIYLIFFPVLFVCFLFFSREIIIFLQKIYGEKLIFFGIVEPITSIVKTAFLISLMVILIPILYSLTNILSEILKISIKRVSFLNLSHISLLLYFIGLTFCLLVTLPFGIKFLVGFQSETLQPAISVSKFVDFTLFLSLIFGLVFQLPIIILLLTYTNIISIDLLKKNRKISFFIIVIISAIITPTPDILNLLMLAIPFYLLYEVGIIISKACV